MGGPENLYFEYFLTFVSFKVFWSITVLRADGGKVAKFGENSVITAGAIILSNSYSESFCYENDFLSLSEE